jgi:ubiquinone/menaquinone biosynthesis C-methylase UbiE
MPLSDFPWPRLGADGPAPVWTGDAFQLAGKRMRVIAYDESDSHWSESLTTLHEEAAGRDHPIDLASRRLALATMKRLKGRPGLRLLDVGCSSGFILDDLRKALPEAGLMGADYIRGPLEKLAVRMAGIPILQFDLRQCPLPDASVDGLTCLNVLEHVDDNESAMRHLFRILKPGGLAHVEVPAGPELFDIYDEHLMHHRRYRRGDLIRLARAAGFRVERATHLGCLVYPAFRFVKRRNRGLLSLSSEEKKRLVTRQIQSTRRSLILAALFRLETAVGRLIPLPCGIRVVAILSKP